MERRNDRITPTAPEMVVGAAWTYKSFEVLKKNV
jgi:hypothetical protein